MNTARQIHRYRPFPAGRSRAAGVKGARARVLGTAMLGAAAGLVFGSAILVGAPVVGGVSSTDGSRFDSPASLSLAARSAPVAAVIAPAPGVERLQGQDRRQANP